MEITRSMTPPSHARVLVAMSGGVDSSLAAALLQEQGFTAEGATLKLTAGVCCDIGSAQAVCAHLGIPHRTIDAQNEFTTAVVHDFIAEYGRGRTPNPCIRCNDRVKFRFLLDYARSQGFSYLATGHYARIERDADRSRFLLKQGIDASKDQSYFLYRLTQDQMAGVLFPLGGLRKTAVREAARRRGLPAAERPESQEVCFVPKDDYRSFLRESAPEALRPGELVLLDGTVVGKHDGIAFFTVGQRRGLGVSGSERLYVVRIEPQTNRVVLGDRAALFATAMTVGKAHLIAGGPLTAPQEAGVKVRSRAPIVRAAIAPVPGGVRVEFVQPVAGVSPGQAAVFYEGDTVIGGGIIEEAIGPEAA